MRIEIYVVDTLIKDTWDLKQIKQSLVGLFGGLTEIPCFNGVFDNKGVIEHDSGKLWIIYTDKPELSESEQFKRILLEIKALTQQSRQAYAINSDLRLI